MRQRLAAAAAVAVAGILLVAAVLFALVRSIAG